MKYSLSLEDQVIKAGGKVESESEEMLRPMKEQVTRNSQRVLKRKMTRSDMLCAKVLRWQHEQ